MARIVTLDTETTGMSHEEDRVVEYAHLVLDSENRTRRGHLTALCDPSPAEISYEAMSVHHITPDMVRGKTKLEPLLTHLDFSEVDYLAAHNMEYDWGFVRGAMPDLPRICTWRCALHLWPEAPSHRNQALRYWLEVEPQLPAGLSDDQLLPHRALFDACVTAEILDVMLHHPSVEGNVDRLVRLTTLPALLTTCNFGKHRGEKWENIPVDYMRWLLRQGDFNEDTLYTARVWKAHRAGGPHPTEAQQGRLL